MDPFKYSFKPLRGDEGFMWILIINQIEAANDPMVSDPGSVGSHKPG